MSASVGRGPTGAPTYAGRCGGVVAQASGEATLLHLIFAVAVPGLVGLFVAPTLPRALQLWFVAGLCAVLAVTAVRVLRLRLEYDDDGVRLVNIYRTTSFRWSELEEIRYAQPWHAGLTGGWGHTDCSAFERKGDVPFARVALATYGLEIGDHELRGLCALATAHGVTLPAT